VQSAGLVEGLLPLAQRTRHFREHIFRERDPAIPKPLDACDSQGVKRGLAAHAATRGRIEMPLQATEIDRDVRSEINSHNVVIARVGCCGAAVLDALYVSGAGHDGFRVQESDRKLGVVAGGAHRDRDAGRRAPAGGFVAETDFQGLLDRDLVVNQRQFPRDRGVSADFLHGNREAAGVHRVSDWRIRPRSISQWCGLQAAMRIVLKN
jgi:hypothetical protein